MRLPKLGKHLDVDLSVEIIRRALDLGVNYVDTAEGYDRGESESIVGKAIQGRREQVYLSTKNLCRKSADEWQERLDGSLERLGVDYIDFYHLHAVRWNVYRRLSRPGKTFERFWKAKQEGLFRHACFSSHDEPKNIVKLIDTGLFDGMLVQYNLLDRANEEVIAYAHEKGLGVAIMGPVGGGRLAPPSERIRGMVGGAKSTPEIALRFVLSNPYVTLALSGMSSLDMVEENVATASRDEPLSAQERQRVSEALEETQRLLDLYCTGCGYCMPCPNNVSIVENLEALSYYKVWGLEGPARERYARLGKKGKKWTWAAACTECGECEPKCPQNIPIRERLKETAATLG
jgi:hypothetical protein